MSKKLLITRCPDKLRWYANKVGEHVDFLGDVGTEYKSREDSGMINFVQYKDAIIIEEEENDKS